MSFALDFFARSDLGLVRDNNEDSAFAGPRLLALADGMGGHAAGEVASQLMIGALSPLDEDEPGSDLTGALARAMHAGNDSIAASVKEDARREGMGCTLTALLFDGRRVGLLHVGDSRAYLLRDGELSQITRDDTFVQSMVDEGRLSADEAHSHPQRSLILKALTGQEVEPTTAVREVRKGDRYLLCSDGLSDPVSESTIRETLGTGTPEEAVDKLISLALRSGGPDNVSVVVAEVVEERASTPARPIVVGAASSESTDSILVTDSAAARAAAFARSQRGVGTPKDSPGGTGESTPKDQSTSPGAAGEGPGKAKARSRKLRVVLPVLIAILVLAGGAIVSAMLIRSNYFVATDDSRVVVKQGIAGDVLGISLSSVSQIGCLDSSGALSLVDADAAPEGCNVLTVGDLRNGARAQVEGGLPSGSLAEAGAQINRLAMDELLPTCAQVEAEALAAATAANAERTPTSEAERPPEDGEGDAPETEPAENPGEPSEEAPAPDAGPDPQQAASPGVNCRAVS